MITKDVIKSEVEAEYQDILHQSLATSAYNIGLDWVATQPVSWNQSSKEDKRAARKKRKECKRALWNHIYNQMVPTENTSVTTPLNDVQVVGFGFIMLAILSGIISWVVQRLLNYYFVSGDIDE